MFRRAALCASFFTLAAASDLSCRSGNGNTCSEEDVEAFEAAEAEAVRMELLQVKASSAQQTEMNVNASELEEAEKRFQARTYAVPYWCNTLSPYSRSVTPSCTSGASCTCMGPSVCGTGATPGSWQSYSYSCCGCARAGFPAQPVAQAVADKAVTVGIAECSANPQCSKLGLTGTCCPNTISKAMLGCCADPTPAAHAVETGGAAAGVVANAAAVPAAAAAVPVSPAPVVAAAVEPAAAAAAASISVAAAKGEVPTVAGVKVPEWCKTLPPTAIQYTPICKGEKTAGGCHCMGEAVCGKPPFPAGSWQSYSSSCCAC
eukprot:TRINITY_DN1905_c0_g2_i2.p1 TRINITY_DN1905_c0_g2~~TRINITY_DN1905_c0_g2_i2.p1  ORF type:complete len:318 (-),score=77.00 TRINITY_DN1905_c0_g2_i2:276-1229(-)